MNKKITRLPEEESVAERLINKGLSVNDILDVSSEPLLNLNRDSIEDYLKTRTVKDDKPSFERDLLKGRRIRTDYTAKKKFVFVPEENGYADSLESLFLLDLGPCPIPEVVDLVYSACLNKDGFIERTMKDMLFGTNTAKLLAHTGQLYVPRKGVYFVDNPEIETISCRQGFFRMKKEEKVIRIEEKELEPLLGSREEDHVVYSDDGKVRFVPSDYIYRYNDVFKSGTFAVGLLSGRENLEKWKEASRSWNFDYAPCVHSSDVHTINEPVKAFTLFGNDGDLYGSSMCLSCVKEGSGGKAYFLGIGK